MTGNRQDKHRGRAEQRKEDGLEKGLEDIFLGSDPVAVTHPPHSACDKYEASGKK